VSSEPEAEYVVPATSSLADDYCPDIERGLLDDDDGLLGRQGVVGLPNLQEEDPTLGSICGRRCIVA
jgi:hypothetical protein